VSFHEDVQAWVGQHRLSAIMRLGMGSTSAVQVLSRYVFEFGSDNGCILVRFRVIRTQNKDVGVG